MDKDIALVYMVAGLSSRFGGRIKQLAHVGPNKETLIELSLKQALPAGFTEIVFVVGEKTEKPFKEKFGDSFNGIPVKYAFQAFDHSTRDKPWGSADALYSCFGVLNSNFVVCNGDDLYGENAFKELVDHFRHRDCCASIGYRLLNVLPETGEVNRAIFEVLDGKVLSIVEKIGLSKQNLKAKVLTGEELCSMNIFGLTNEALIYFGEDVKKFKDIHKKDRKIECYLPEVVNKLIKCGKISMDLHLTNDKWIGITHPEDEETVRKSLSLETN